MTSHGTQASNGMSQLLLSWTSCSAALLRARQQLWRLHDDIALLGDKHIAAAATKHAGCRHGRLEGAAHVRVAPVLVGHGVELLSAAAELPT